MTNAYILGDSFKTQGKYFFQKLQEISTESFLKKIDLFMAQSSSFLGKLCLTQNYSYKPCRKIRVGNGLDVLFKSATFV